MQCSAFLSGLTARRIETANTALSARFAAEEVGASAAVCSAEAAKLYGLEVIAPDICNTQSNQTRFAVVCKQETYAFLKQAEGSGALSASIYFEIKNQIGSLHSALDSFKSLGINMVSLHSLPIPGEMWSYGFYVEADKVNPENIQKAVNALALKLQKVKLLGVYSTINA